jgi:hypothetical protein
MRRLLALAIALVVTPAAGAATLTLTITTGSPVTAPGATLSGIDQTKTFAIAVSEAYTGAGNTAGWNVTAASTTLTSVAKTLPALVVTTVARGACTGTGCINPTNSITWPITLSTTAKKIYDAAANTGEGTVVLTGTYEVTYPANALPGTYSATVTLATSTGP